MTEFHFKGKVSIKGVDIYIDAKTMEAAITRAKAHDYDIWESDVHCEYDWEIDISSGRVND